MWKYVSRRIKEAVERTQNVLDIHKTWSCGAPQQVKNASSNVSNATIDDEYICVTFPCTTGSASLAYIRCEKKGRREQNRRGCVVGDLLGAITWSSAIICGWYASQLLCLNRRQLGWDNSRYMQVFNIPTRAIHSKLLSHCVLASPNYPSLVTERALHDKFSTSTPRHEAAIFDVNNEQDDHRVRSNDKTHQKTTAQKQQNVGDAIADLVSFLGETEYKMGIKRIAARQYRSAVAHLKLATSHNHPGATFNLGLCYEKGLGVTKNLKRAMECYQIASSMGHSKAMYNLGVFYARGLGGLEQDSQAAKKCFITAAKLGQSEAIAALGGGFHDRPIRDGASDISPITELIFEKNNAKFYAAAAATFI